MSALADRLRRDVLSRLEHGPLSVSELAAPYPVSLPAVSRHVKLLERAGLIIRRVKGPTHHLSLAIPVHGLALARRWLDIGLRDPLGNGARRAAARGIRASPSPAFRRGLHWRYRPLEARRLSSGCSPVSYTHRTLPTLHPVSISVVVLHRLTT